MIEWRIPRESKELVGPIGVLVDGVPVTDFQVALIPRSARPVESDWTPPMNVDGEFYVLVGPGARVLPVGSYYLWPRYTSNPEVPVLNPIATIHIT